MNTEVQTSEEGIQTSLGDKVKLDVGGHRFVTTRQTLMSEPESLLAQMSDGTGGFVEEADGTGDTHN